VCTQSAKVIRTCSVCIVGHSEVVQFPITPAKRRYRRVAFAPQAIRPVAGDYSQQTPSRPLMAFPMDQISGSRPASLPSKSPAAFRLGARRRREQLKLARMGRAPSPALHPRPAPPVGPHGAGQGAGRGRPSPEGPPGPGSGPGEPPWGTAPLVCRQLAGTRRYSFENDMPAKLTTLCWSMFHCSYCSSLPRAWGAAFRKV